MLNNTMLDFNMPQFDLVLNINGIEDMQAVEEPSVDHARITAEALLRMVIASPLPSQASVTLFAGSCDRGERLGILEMDPDDGDVSWLDTQYSSRPSDLGRRFRDDPSDELRFF